MSVYLSNIQVFSFQFSVFSFQFSEVKSFYVSLKTHHLDPIKNKVGLVKIYVYSAQNIQTPTKP